MTLVAEQQLQRVPPRRQLQNGLGLPVAEVQMVLVRGNLLVERRQPDIDQQVMVAGVRNIDAGGSDPHVAEPEPHPKAAVGQAAGIDDFAVVGPANVDVCIVGRRGVVLGPRSSDLGMCRQCV